MKIRCSNCATTITLDLDQGTATYTRPGAGRGSKRIPEATIVTDVFYDEPLFMWDSPCCTVDGYPYPDSYEEGL